MDGWVKLHRKLLNSDMYKSLNSTHRDVMVQCLLLASHKRTVWSYKGDLHACSPGQFKTSLETLRSRCAKKTTIKQVRGALDKLGTWGFLASERASTGRIITILNWTTYQNGYTSEGQTKGHAKGQSEGKARATIKNDKNVKNDKKIKDICLFWNNLGIIKHKGITRFENIIKARLNNYSSEEITEAMSNYKKILEGSEYFFTYRWTLDEFLSRKGGIDKFLVTNKPFETFRKGANGRQIGKRKPEIAEQEKTTVGKYGKAAQVINI